MGWVSVQWRSGQWFIGPPDTAVPSDADTAWLDAWLAAHGDSRSDLHFGSNKGLEQRFVHDFGPVRTTTT